MAPAPVYINHPRWGALTMKFSTIAMTAALLAALAGISVADEMPFDQVRYEALQNSGKPFAVAFHADWCPTCRAQAPVLKELTQAPQFKGITVFVANFDTEKVLERSLGVTKQSTIVVFKDGKESARSTGDTQRENLAELLRHAAP
jgi:thiol-disulfide isomerase/thioredoxin